MNYYLFKQAVKITSPIFFGYLAIGIPFGIMTVNAGYPWYFAPFMSLFMYAGAGQYVAIGMLAVGASLSEILIAEFFVNIRHIVYGLSLITKFKAMGKWKAVLAYALTDETYAVLSNLELPKNAKAGPFYGTVALLDFAYWTLGGTIGALACSIIHKYNMESWLQGVDFALTALFIVILIEQIKKSHDVLPPAIGLISCTGTLILCKVGILPQNNIILVAIIIGIVAIILLRGRRKTNATLSA